MAGFGDENRIGAVATLSNFPHDRDFAQERNVERMRKPRASAMSEDFMAMAAFPALIVAHVLYYAEHRHTDLLEHGDPALDIEQGDFLRRGHNHAAIQHDALRY